MYDDLRIALKGYYTTYKRKRYSKPLQNRPRAEKCITYHVTALQW